MEKDPDYLAEEESFLAAKRDDQLKEIMLRFDSNGDGELDRDELGWLERQVKLFSHAPPECWLVIRFLWPR